MKQRTEGLFMTILEILRAIRFGVMIFLTIALFVVFSLMDGVITKSDLMSFIAAVITALSFGLTFALAVLAINAFGSFREIETLKREAEAAKQNLVDRAVNIETLINILQGMTETISSKLVELSIEREERDHTYFRLLHSRLCLKMLVESNNRKRINIARDILGSMEPGESPEVVRWTVSQLRGIRWQDPSEARMLEPLIHLGESIIEQEAARS